MMFAVGFTVHIDLSPKREHHVINFEFRACLFDAVREHICRSSTQIRWALGLELCLRLRLEDPLKNASKLGVGPHASDFLETLLGGLSINGEQLVSLALIGEGNIHGKRIQSLPLL